MKTKAHVLGIGTSKQHGIFNATADEDPRGQTFFALVEQFATSVLRWVSNHLVCIFTWQHGTLSYQLGVLEFES